VIVRIEGSNVDAVSLASPEDFTRFHVELIGTSADDAELALVACKAGRMIGDEKALIAVDGLVRLAGELADETWRAKLDGMIAYAQKKGWWDEATRSIAAHIETR
jgi:hypothetical protein